MAEGLFALITFLLLLALAIVLPVWVYSNAKRNSPHSPFLWALVVFFGGLLGLLLYFIPGRTERGRRGSRGTY